MKLKDLVESAGHKETFDKWYADNRFEGMPAQLKYQNGRIVKYDILKSSGSSYKLNGFTKAEHLSGPKRKFEGPQGIPPTAWSVSRMVFENYEFEDYEDVPDVQVVLFKDCVFKSFKGIEKKRQLVNISFGGHDPKDVLECGVLRIIKSQAQVCMGINNQTEMSKLCHIISDNLKDKDTVEAQSQLIDAGFEEYAKL